MRYNLIFEMQGFESAMVKERYLGLDIDFNSYVQARLRTFAREMLNVQCDSNSKYITDKAIETAIAKDEIRYVLVPEVKSKKVIKDALQSFVEQLNHIVEIDKKAAAVATVLGAGTQKSTNSGSLPLPTRDKLWVVGDDFEVVATTSLARQQKKPTRKGWSKATKEPLLLTGEIDQTTHQKPRTDFFKHHIYNVAGKTRAATELRQYNDIFMHC
jgi:hypothetical protein